MNEDRSWCVVLNTGNYYAMPTKGTYKAERINENLTREEAEAVMKLLRITQGESK